jgi:hypothetical protein
MAIGEFGGAPAATGDNGPMYAAPAYWFYEMSQAALNPSRAFADAERFSSTTDCGISSPSHRANIAHEIAQQGL